MSPAEIRMKRLLSWMWNGNGIEDFPTDQPTPAPANAPAPTPVDSSVSGTLYFIYLINIIHTLRYIYIYIYIYIMLRVGIVCRATRCCN